jgi:hypothetical protein
LINSINDEEECITPTEIPEKLEIPLTFTSAATSSFTAFVDHYKAERPGRMN